MKRLAKKDCSRCNRSAGEAFWCYKSRYIFDVDLARELTAVDHEIMELDPEDVDYSVGRCVINEGHLPHVNTEIPGIVAHIFYPDENGEVVHAHRLIDGHHRAARCLQLGIPFPVRVLTELESEHVPMKAPRGARPRLGDLPDDESRSKNKAKQKKKGKKSKTKQGHAKHRDLVKC